MQMIRYRAFSRNVADYRLTIRTLKKILLIFVMAGADFLLNIFYLRWESNLNQNFGKALVFSSRRAHEL